MKTKIIISVIIVLAVILFYLFITANGFSFYNEGMVLIHFSGDGLEKELKFEYLQGVQIKTITDDDLKSVPKIKELIEKSLTTEFPVDTTGTAPITYDELYNFQQQYSEILAAKYFTKSTDYFTTNTDISKKYLAIEPSAYLRSFEGRYFEYDGKQYGIQPDILYVPSIEDNIPTRLDVYKTNGPLREEDHTWADLSENHVDINH